MEETGTKKDYVLDTLTLTYGITPTATYWMSND
jgi:hypothetical protein